MGRSWTTAEAKHSQKVRPRAWKGSRMIWRRGRASLRSIMLRRSLSIRREDTRRSGLNLDIYHLTSDIWHLAFGIWHWLIGNQFVRDDSFSNQQMRNIKSQMSNYVR